MSVSRHTLVRPAYTRSAKYLLSTVPQRTPATTHQLAALYSSLAPSSRNTPTASPPASYDAAASWSAITRAFHSSLGQRQEVVAEAKPVVPEGFVAKPGPTAVPVPEQHKQLFETGALPAPDAIVKPTDRVKSLFQELMDLSQFEVVQLTNVLNKSYGVDSRALGSNYGFGSGGFFTQGQVPAAAPAAAAAAPAAAEEAKPAAAAQTSFTIRLDGFDAANKIKVIKEVRAATGLGLKESKELVESAPKVIKKDLSKADCDALVAKLKEAGAKITLE